MQLDEWSMETYDEWETPLYEAINQPTSPQSIVGQSTGPFPEVEIGSTSDDEAPPVPESTQLARENLELRTRVNSLKQQSTNLEQKNSTLKNQLMSFRNAFKKQIKGFSFK